MSITKLSVVGLRDACQTEMALREGSNPRPPMRMNGSNFLDEPEIERLLSAAQAEQVVIGAARKLNETEDPTFEAAAKAVWHSPIGEHLI